MFAIKKKLKLFSTFLLLLFFINANSQNIWMEFASGDAEFDSLYKKALDVGEFDKNFDKAYNLATSFEKKSEEQKNPVISAQSHCLYGTLFRMNGNYPLAMKYFQSALKKIGKKYSNQQAFIHYSIYRNYIEQADFKNGLSELYKALHLYETEKNEYGISRIKTEIGGLFSYRGDKKMTEKYLSEAKILAEKLNDKELIFLNNLYETAQLLTEKKLPEALNSATKYLQEIKANNSKKILGYCFENISTINYEQKNYKNALAYLDSAIANTQRSSEIAMYQTNKALILSEIGKSDEAEKMLLKFLNDHKNSQRLDYLISARKILIDIYTKKGEKNKAAEEIVKNNTLTEQLNKTKKNDLLREQEYEYDLKKKELQIAEKNSMIKIAGGVSAATLALAGFALFIYRKREKKKQKNTIFELENLIHEKEKLKQKEGKLLKQKDDAERELAANTMYLSENKQVLKDLIAELNDLKNGKTVNVEKIAELEKKIKSVFKNENDWEKMIIHFEKVYPDFFKKLRIINPKLTKNELKHCAYIRIKLNNKETAQILGVEPSSVKTTRYRLKKKFNLGVDDDLNEFIARI